MAREGLPFLLSGLAVTAMLYWGVRRYPVWILSAVFCLFSVWFFRNPDRLSPNAPSVVVSPADGRVVFAGDVPPGAYTRVASKKVSVFMSPLNVHVNRAPVAGTVEKIRYNKGKYFRADAEKSSFLNEQNGVTLRLPSGDEVTYVQIAGFIARRIVCDLSEGDSVRQGQRVGLIRFGSRADVYMPVDSKVSVKVGDKVRAGETIVGVLRGCE